MRRPWVLVGLIVLALVGGVLILTAGDDDPGPQLETVTTEEGLVTEVPLGWVAEGAFVWEFQPPGGVDGFDGWSVARACPLDGCAAATLAEWTAEAGALPSFVDMRAADGDSLFDVVEEELSDAYVLRATTATAGRIVVVAAFADGAEEYVACSVRLALGADERLADEIVRVCRETASSL
ncbi:MAG: hypothetical protein DHS20C19_19530 [Acidimicrobiales bacterium]|nr:MAG: hypothetical protein DHS20C19_19530 [Acidimicrobiales bacterium]